MRSVHFIWEFPPSVGGGLGTSASELTRFLVRLGNEVTVLSMNPDNQLPTTDNWKGVDVHRPMIADMSDVFPVFVDHDLRGWGDNLKFFSDVMAYNTLATTKFLNSINRGDRRKFDLVHAHSWMGITAGASVKKSTKLPLAFQVHSTEKGRSNGMGSRTVEELEFLGSRKANIVVTVSNAMKKEIVTLGMARPEKVHVCYNGVDTNNYNPDKAEKDLMDRLRTYYGIEDGQRMILFIGRITRTKSPTNLITAMTEVIEDLPETKLVMVGVGELSQEVKDLINTHELKDHVKFRNEYISIEEKRAHYAIADLCVFPSIYEPFGISCMEAMSMQRPVVVGASGTNGLKEQVIPDGPNKNGIHIDGNDPSDIAWGIQEALSSDDQLRRMGDNARKRAVENFDWEDMAQDMVDIYKVCVRDNGH